MVFWQRSYVLDTTMKRGAELSTDDHLVMNWIWWRRNLPGRPCKPKCIAGVNLEHMAKPSVRATFNSHPGRVFPQVGDMEPESAMF